MVEDIRHRIYYMPRFTAFRFCLDPNKSGTQKYTEHIYYSVTIQVLSKLLPFQFFFQCKKNHVKHVEKLNTDRISFLDAPRRWRVEFSLKKKVVPFDLSQCLLNHRNQEQEHMKDCNIPQINTIEAKAI